VKAGFFSQTLVGPTFLVPFFVFKLGDLKWNQASLPVLAQIDHYGVFPPTLIGRAGKGNKVPMFELVPVV
jgi:hypothetical protein